MKTWEALKAADEGKKIRRSWWVKGMYIYVQRNAKNGSFGEFLNSLDIHACIDVRVVDHNDKTVDEFHDKDFCSNDKYNDYLVKRISISNDGWDGRISVVIEPDDYVWSYVGY